jgi:multiple sugar transport system substrate-binding protein
MDHQYAQPTDRSRRRLNRRQFVSIGLAAAAGPLLAACGGPAASPTTAPNAAEPTKPVGAAATSAPAGATTPAAAATTAPVATAAGAAKAPASGERIQVTWWANAAEAVLRVDNAVTQAYNESQSKVELVRGNNPPTGNLRSIFASGSGPDFINAAVLGVWPNCNAGVLAPLSDYIEFAGLTKLAPEGDLEPYRWTDGKFYHLPWKSGTVMTAYNTKLFQEAGLDPTAPPKTWSQALQAAKQTTKADQGQFGWGFGNWGLYGAEGWRILFHLLPYHYNAGGQEFLPLEGTNHKIDQPEFLKTLEFFRELGLAEVSPKAAAQVDYIGLFGQGKMAMIDIIALWVGDFDIKYAGLEYEIMPLPIADGAPISNAYTIDDNYPFMMLNTTKYMAEVWDAMQFIVGRDEIGALALRQGGTLLSRTDLTTNSTLNAALKDHPNLLKFAAEIPNIKPWPRHLNTTAALDAMQREISLVVLGQQSPQEAINKMKPQVEQALAG